MQPKAVDAANAFIATHSQVLQLPIFTPIPDLPALTKAAATLLPWTRVPSAAKSALMSTAAFSPSPISVSGLRLERGGKTLLTGFSLDVQPGEALVLLGPNGSGKTTLLRAMGGLVRPAGGEISLDPQSVAFLGHADALKASETVEQSLRFWARLYGGDVTTLDPVMVDMALAHLARRTCGTLSAGQKRRTALARIALSNRPVWLLDEPAAPLDARSRARLASLVRQHCEAGGIVIAATHVDLGWAGARVEDLRPAPTRTAAGVG